MRLIAAAAVLAAVLASGCKKTQQEIEQEQASRDARFRQALHLYFKNLNDDAHQRKDSVRAQMYHAENNPILPPPEGSTFSSYSFDDTAFMVYNYVCRTCGSKLILHLNETLAEQYLCPACRHSPYQVHPPNTDLRKSPCTQCITNDKPAAPDTKQYTREWFQKFEKEGVAVGGMYELVDKDLEKPFKAKVRYVRKSWSYDPKGVLSVPQKAITNAASDAKYLPTAGSAIDFDPLTGKQLPKYDLQGFHRLDGIFAGEMDFEFTSGGRLSQVGGTREQPFRPWKDIPQKNNP